MRLRLDLSIPLSAGRALRVDVDSTASCWALSGASGSGKSSLVRALVGVESRASGTIAIDGVPWLETSRTFRIAAHERGVGWAPQEAVLFPHLSVAENLAFSRRLSATEDDVNAVADLLELKSVLPRQPRHLSGGERQRVALGRALLSAPTLLLLDEPFAALDRPLRRRVSERLGQWLCQRSLPAIIVSHDPADVLPLADVFWELQDGRLQTGSSV